MLGKSVSDLQSNIEVGTGVVTGELKYVDDYTGFSGNTDYQKGNYLVLHFDAEDADYVTIELIGGLDGRGEITLDADGIAILRISSTDQKVRVRCYKDDTVCNVTTYSLAGLTLAPADGGGE